MSKKADTEEAKPAESKRPAAHETEPPSSEKLSKSFDPYDYGMEDGFGVWGAVVHLVRITFGSGFLLLPYTMKSIGYVTGIGLLFLVSVFYYHSMHILVRHEYRLCKLLNAKHITYASLARKTFENMPFPCNVVGVFVGRLMFAYFCLSIYNSTYLLVFAGSVQNLAAYFGCRLETGCITAAVMIPLICICTFRRLLKILVPFSAITNFFSIAMAFVLLACSAIYRQPQVTLRPFGDPKLIPQTFALYLQALICTCSILPVKNYMRQPRRLGSPFGALNISAFTLTFLFVNFAFFAYFCYGDRVEKNILLNLPANNALSFIIHLLYAFAMFVIYLLSFSVVFDNVWSDLEPKFGNTTYLKLAAEYGVRLGLNAWSYFLAVGIPNLTLVLTLSGTFAVALEVGLTPFMELALAVRNWKKNILTIFKDLAIITISGVVFYLSLKDCLNEVALLHSE